jgi:DNA-binding response OmpR family regulator
MAKAFSNMKNMDLCALVVEDEKLLNWSLAKSLAKWGFEVHPVFTARDAVIEIEHGGFDIILLDYQLPDLDGLEVARRVRALQPNAVIFLVTAFQLNELPVEAGLIDGYFNKPLDLQQLHQALKRVPKRHATGGNLGTSASC